MDSSSVEQIKALNDIVEVISNYVTLRKAGKNLVGLCPFHSEKTGSFSVSPERQFFHCFGCGTGGDVINFIMRMERLPFVEAVTFLASRAGITLRAADGFREDGPSGEREELLDLAKFAEDMFSSWLWDNSIGREAREYLDARGVQEGVARRLGLGYAPPGWDRLADALGERGVSAPKAVKAGLLIENSQGRRAYDRFRNRLVFPIKELSGRTVGFGGRSLDGSHPKYLNSPESPIYVKGKVLYGLDLAREAVRKSGRIILVEGYMDAISLHQAGFAETAASCGTSLTADHARILARFTDKVVVAYDADTAGRKSALRGLDVLKAAGLSVSVVDLPDGYDPDSFIRREGGPAFEGFLGSAEGLVDYKIRSVLGNVDSGGSEGKVKMAAKVVAILAEIESPIEREEHIAKVSQRLGISRDSLTREVQSFEAKAGRLSRARHRIFNSSYTKGDSGDTDKRSTDAGKGVAEAVPNRLRPGPEAVAERELLKLLLLWPDVIDQANQVLCPEDFREPAHRKLASHLFSSLEKGRSELPGEAYGQDPELAGLIGALFFEGVPPVKDRADEYIDRVWMHRARERMRSVESELDSGSTRPGSQVEFLWELMRRYKRLIDEFSERRPHLGRGACSRGRDGKGGRGHGEQERLSGN